MIKNKQIIFKKKLHENNFLKNKTGCWGGGTWTRDSEPVLLDTSFNNSTRSQKFQTNTGQQISAINTEGQLNCRESTESLKKS